MPWLVGTALIHSLAVTEKRGTFKSWTVLLAIVAFSLSLLGTFLVRSGVLTSVHAFATDPARGVFILVFLVIVIGGSLALFALRAPRVGGGGRFAPVSRESMLLANNVLLVVAMASVLLGTLYPLFLDALALGKISVGPPYFETVFVPLMAPLVFLMGVGPARDAGSAPSCRRCGRGCDGRSRVAIVLRAGAAVRCSAAGRRCVAVGPVPRAVGGRRHGRDRRAAAARRAAGDARRASCRANPARGTGMLLAHLGIAVFIVGVTLVKGYEIERDVRMAPGAERRGRRLRVHVRGRRASSRARTTRRCVGTVEVARDGGALIEVLHPEKRVYRASGQTMTEAAIDTRPDRRPLRVARRAGRRTARGAWGVRIYHKPFVDWIWGGCVLMALGGFLAHRRPALSHRRRDRATAALAGARA